MWVTPPVLVDLRELRGEVVAGEHALVERGGLVKQIEGTRVVTKLGEQTGQVDVDVGDVARVAPEGPQSEAGPCVVPAGAVEVAAVVGDVAEVLLDRGDVPPGLDVDVEVAGSFVAAFGRTQVSQPPVEAAQVAGRVGDAGGVAELGEQQQRGVAPSFADGSRRVRSNGASVRGRGEGRPDPVTRPRAAALTSNRC
jgi:hypothetical protein